MTVVADYVNDGGILGGQLPAGWEISSRLMACWTFSDGSLLEVAPPRYRLTGPDGVEIEDSSDYQPGMSLVHWREILEEFVDFLRSYVSCDHGAECPFRPGWHEWCAAHEQEIENLHCELMVEDEEPHTGHYSRLGGTYWCDTCNSPYCERA